VAGDICGAAGVFVGVVPVEDTSGVSGLAAGASSFVGVPVPVGVVAEDSAFEFALGAGGDVGAPASVPEKGAGPLPVGSVADEPPQALKKRTAALISPNR
jgi:hypothetical protein